MLVQSTSMWVRKSIFLLTLVSLLTASPNRSSSNCPRQCNCQENDSIVTCPGKTTLKDWFRIGSTISGNASYLLIQFADFTDLSLSNFKMLPNFTELRINKGRLINFPRGLPQKFPHLKIFFIFNKQITEIL